MSEHDNVFTKENLDTYLKELAKEYRRLNGKTMPADIVLIGGAAILANYGFREMTTDIDAVIGSASSMKEAINCVGDKYNLPSGWLNSDFMRTDSYSPRLIEHSRYYRQFSNVLTIRTVTAEYLIAMKLRSGRKYKNDLSDIMGILAAHEEAGNPITWEQVDRAVRNLYGDWNSIPEDSRTFIETAFRNGNYVQTYESVRAEEKRSKDILLRFDEDYPGVAGEGNVNQILASLRAKQDSKPSVREKLRKLQAERLSQPVSTTVNQREDKLER